MKGNSRGRTQEVGKGRILRGGGGEMEVIEEKGQKAYQREEEVMEESNTERCRRAEEHLAGWSDWKEELGA